MANDIELKIGPAMKPNASAKRIPIRIRQTLAATGVGVGAMMIVLVMWMIQSLDGITRNYTFELVETSLREKTREVEVTTRDEARWGAGKGWRLAPNGQAIYGDLGAAATRSGLIHQSYVFGPAGKILYSFEVTSNLIPLRDAVFEIAPFFVDQVQNVTADPGFVATGFVRLNDRLAYVAATRLQPEDSADLALQDLPVVVNVMTFNPAILAQMGWGELVQDVHITFQHPTHSHELPLRLSGQDEQAYIGWVEPDHYREFLLRSIGPVLLILALVVGGHVYVGYVVTRLTRAFLKESQDARTDGLTGLLNRTGFDEKTKNRRVVEALKEGRLAVMICDMDKFKPINDTYGHHAGDKALQTIAGRLQALAGKDDIVARLGGDEFAVIVIHDQPKDAVIKLIEQLDRANRRGVRVDGIPIALQASTGYALAQDAEDIRQLMMAADASMYQAKIARNSERPQGTRVA